MQQNEFQMWVKTSASIFWRHHLLSAILKTNCGVHGRRVQRSLATFTCFVTWQWQKLALVEVTMDLFSRCRKARETMAYHTRPAVWISENKQMITGLPSSFLQELLLENLDDKQHWLLVWEEDYNQLNFIIFLELTKLSTPSPVAY